MVFITGSQSTRLSREGALRLFLSVVLWQYTEQSADRQVDHKYAILRNQQQLKFKEFLEKTANNEAPWKLYGVKLEKDDLLALADKFPDYALRYEMGLGDMSIIHFYEKYKEETPAVGHIMIWSTDRHLSGYEEEVSIKRRKDR